jgi:hypothetical protein
VDCEAQFDGEVLIAVLRYDLDELLCYVHLFGVWGFCDSFSFITLAFSAR